MLARILVLFAFAIFGSHSQAPNPCRSLGPGQQFAASPRGCHWFFYCADPQDPLEARCPDGLHFDAFAQSCGYPDLISPRCTLDEDILERTRFECPSNNDFRIIPHPFDCAKYTLCWQREQDNIDCPSGQHFSLFENDCVEEDFADCQAEERFCKSGNMSEFRENPFSCEDFRLCTECENKFTIHEWVCPPGFAYDKSIKSCRNSADFTCTAVDSSNFVAPELPWTTICENAEALRVPHPGDCNLYFLCATPQSNSILMRCPRGLKFDSVSFECILEAENPTCYQEIPSPVAAPMAPRKRTNAMPRIVGQN